jgi:hypothetical protein
VGVCGKGKDNNTNLMKHCQPSPNPTAPSEGCHAPDRKQRYFYKIVFLIKKNKIKRACKSVVEVTRNIKQSTGNVMI